MEKENIGKVMIYCAGGAGINAGTFFTGFRDGKQQNGFAEMQVTFIDTSRSNITEEIIEEEIYLIDGLDGSGKIRAENHRQISESIHDVLLKHPPGDLNIVISSASGGSGSVIAPSLVSELLKRDKNVVASIITSTDSRIEIENSIKTLKSYEAIATLRERPVVILPYQNNKETTRWDVNKLVVQDIIYLSALFSRQNKELDSADLRNWLNYTRVTSAKPKLVSMSFSHQKIDSGKYQILTVATLAYADMPTSLGSPVDYQCVGYVQGANEENIAMTTATHYLIIDGQVVAMYEKLASALKEIEEVNMAKKRSTASIVKDSDHVNDDGLVL